MLYFFNEFLPPVQSTGIDVAESDDGATDDGDGNNGSEEYINPSDEYIATSAGEIIHTLLCRVDRKLKSLNGLVGVSMAKISKGAANGKDSL